ncbi:MAG: PadR family transcriptional regulator [Solirubrobacterales bacterium]|nr:MAG: PadR family transcriptional regulator [Solirubrobacterales bacterium]
MTGNSFAQQWPGREAWGHRAHRPHRHGPRGWAITKDEGTGRHGWAFAKGKGTGRHGRPSPEELEELIALRRMRGMRGGPFGGGPFGGGPFGHGRRGRGRGRARRGDVRLALLRLLAEEPRNGYQLMQTIEERSDGRWRPSPGSVYPTLAQLEDEGLVRSTESEGAKHFEITDAGREYLETRAAEPAPWDDDDEESNPLSDIGPLVVQIGKAAWQVASVGDEAQRARATELLSETRRGLYRILAEDPQD